MIKLLLFIYLLYLLNFGLEERYRGRGICYNTCLLKGKDLE